MEANAMGALSKAAAVAVNGVQSMQTADVVHAPTLAAPQMISTSLLLDKLIKGCAEALSE